MISGQILRSSSSLTRLCYHLTRFGSTLPKESSSSQSKWFHSYSINYFCFIFSDKSTSKSNTGKKSASEYLADDMYSYTTFSYYDIETSMIKYRLPQPSPNVPFKPPEPAPQKK